MVIGKSKFFFCSKKKRIFKLKIPWIEFRHGNIFHRALSSAWGLIFGGTFKQDISWVTRVWYKLKWNTSEHTPLYKEKSSLEMRQKEFNNGLQKMANLLPSQSAKLTNIFSFHIEISNKLGHILHSSNFSTSNKKNLWLSYIILNWIDWFFVNQVDQLIYIVRVGLKHLPFLSDFLEYNTYRLKLKQTLKLNTGS